MRALLLVALMPLAAHAQGLELELAPSIPVSEPSAPALRARIGADLGWLTPSLAVFAAILDDPGPLIHFNQTGGFRAWGIAAQARAHTGGRHQLIASLGAGWGQLVARQLQNGDMMGYRGQPAPYLQGSIGYRYARQRWRLGLELTADVFNRVERQGDYGIDFCSPGQCPTNTPYWVAGLALTLGFGSEPID